MNGTATDRAPREPEGTLHFERTAKRQIPRAAYVLFVLSVRLWPSCSPCIIFGIEVSLYSAYAHAAGHAPNASALQLSAACVRASLHTLHASEWHTY